MFFFTGPRVPRHSRVVQIHLSPRPGYPGTALNIPEPNIIKL